MTDRRFIEETFPVKEISEISAKEKNIRTGSISSLHIWWARRPLSASRSTVIAALTGLTTDTVARERKRDFLIEISRWENTKNESLIDGARKYIWESHAERRSKEENRKITAEDIASGKVPPPRVLDPFAGGGSYPLEALRMGCETYASDYNPVATLILKATLEYPQKFGKLIEENVESELFNGLIQEKKEVNPLLEAVKKWGLWVFETTKADLENYYPEDQDGSIPIGYIWARTIPCQNPSCGISVPLIRQLWLANKKNKKVAVYMEIKNDELLFRIVGEGYGEWPENFDPKRGTVSSATATCPVCGSVIERDLVHKLLWKGKGGHKLVAIVLHNSKAKTKTYRVATKHDYDIFDKAESELIKVSNELRSKWGIEPVPDEIIHTPDGKEYKPGGLNYKFNSILLYGFTRWGDIFNSRQNLAHIVFSKNVQLAYEEMISQGINTEFARAVITYIAFVVSRIPDTNSTLCHWDGGWEKTATTFARQALSMNWDYIEANPFGDKGYNFRNILRTIALVVENLSNISESIPVVSQASATHLHFPDNYFDAIFTDPPYYDNVPYSDLSDFFYVWLKRSIGYLYPEYFSTPLTPKSLEVIAELPLLRGMKKEEAVSVVKGIKTSRFFEDKLSEAFKESYRVLKPDGVIVLVYAHKSITGWETIINSLLDSGLVVTSAWPIHTELASRLRAKESAALASSIYIIARKSKRESTGLFNEVRDEIQDYLDDKLNRLWEEGIGGADFFISAIGSAIEVFGKYKQVIDYEGNVIRANRLLEEVRKIATNFAVKQILHNGFAGEISSLTRLYVLWRWNYQDAKVPFDEARKLAQSCGVDIVQAWNKVDYIQKQKEFVRLLGPQNRKLEKLEGGQNLIDTLHKALLLWESGQRESMNQVLAKSGFGKQETFYRVAQAISETLSKESKEKKLLDGFLTGKDRIIEEVSKVAEQMRLFE